MTTISTTDSTATTKRHRQGRSTKQLACTNCRRKKVKCHPGPNGPGTTCDLCHRLQEVCWTPPFDERRRVHTKQLIAQLRSDNAELQAENAQLRAELEDHRRLCRVDGNGGCDHNFQSGSFSSGMSDGSSEVSTSDEAPDEAAEQTTTQRTATAAFTTLASSSSSSVFRRSDNMIMRLCSGQRQLNSDRVGRLRFFGPTSSLHLVESVTSSLLICGSSRGGRDGSNGRRGGGSGGSSGVAIPTWQTDFPPQVQEHLLDLYWTYQHQVLPWYVTAFLRDMRNGDTKYCSSLLVMCILTRAAAISSEPALRALALADDAEAAEDDPPYLVRKCVVMLEHELDAPGITTAQALQLLSEMHCAISHDTKGWMYAGGAGRLAYELGLHRDPDDFDSSGFGTTSTSVAADMTQLDKEVRQVVFWSCFNLDRAWALYLGRPQSIRLEDVDAKRPGEGGAADTEPTGEVRMAAAWCSLLEIVGKICEILNGVHTPRWRLGKEKPNLHVQHLHLVQRLEQWRATLHPSLQYETSQTPAMIILRMQYAAAMILLHRPLAQFGTDLTALPSPAAADAAQSRQICIEDAGRIARCLQEYADGHGSVMTMSWVSLHIVATAATTLIASIAEHRPPGTMSDSDMAAVAPQLDSLRRCLTTLNELEKSHVVARRVRKVIQSTIRLLNMDAVIKTGPGNSSGGGKSSVGISGIGGIGGGMIGNWPMPFAVDSITGFGMGTMTGVGLPWTTSTSSSLAFLSNMGMGGIPATAGLGQHSDGNTAGSFPLGNFLPSSNAPVEFLNSFETCFT
ncbi:hypothetical protein Sste5346_010420 [Sporothrix stenoceras]|uniref:Zn(2)-C6 fungal-type domain-containing protein n=1 Tax=Sporothrix stenoceras TaxID=5173 RepID=A0ABR3YFR1_9PEZI